MKRRQSLHELPIGMNCPTGHCGQEYIAKSIMKENKLVEISKQFAVDIVTVCSEITESRKNYVLVNQLLRSGTSIGANIHEANYAASKADFINKLQIALKECYETEYWLDLFKTTSIMSAKYYDMLSAKCSKIRILLISSINTTKEN